MNLIGIDLGVHKLAMVYLSDTPAATDYEAPYSLPRDQQLHELGSAAQTWAVLHQADQIWIEDVLTGNNHKYSLALAETKGAVLSSLAQLRPACDIWTVNVKTWKKQVVGNGNASKEQVRNYIDVTYPLYAPFCDGDQDRYDAACVGLYGLRIAERAEQLSAGRLVAADRSDLAGD